MSILCGPAGEDASHGDVARLYADDEGLRGAEVERLIRVVHDARHGRRHCTRHTRRMFTPTQRLTAHYSKSTHLPLRRVCSATHNSSCCTKTSNLISHQRTGVSFSPKCHRHI